MPANTKRKARRVDPFKQAWRTLLSKEVTAYWADMDKEYLASLGTRRHRDRTVRTEVMPPKELVAAYWTVMDEEYEASSGHWMVRMIPESEVKPR